MQPDAAVLFAGVIVAAGIIGGAIHSSLAKTKETCP